MKTKTKIKKIPIGPLIDILLSIEEAGMDFIDIEVTHVSKDFDKMKILAKEYYIAAQEGTPSKFDGNRINDIIA